MDIDIELLNDIKDKLEGVLYRDEELSDKDIQQIINAIDDITVQFDE